MKKPAVDTAVDTDAQKPKTTAQKLSPTGFPGLYRHENGQYYGRKKVRGTVKQAVLKTKDDFAITDRKIAERALMTWADSLESQTAAAGKRMTLDGLLTAYNDLNAGKKKKTYEGYQFNAKCVREGSPKMLAVTVDKITPLDVSKILAAHYEAMKGRTYNGFSEYLNRLFTFAETNGFCAESPFEKAENKRKKFRREKPHAPTLEQFTQIVASVRNQPFADTREESADLMEFLGLAALGEAEAENLQWKDVDFDAEQLQIERQKTGVFFQVPFYPWLKSFLVDLRTRQNNPAGVTKVFKVKGCKQALKMACGRLKLPHFSPRNLRQFGIIRQLRAGLPVKDVALYQGHRDGGKLILDTYSEVISADDAAYRKAVIARMKDPTIATPAE